MIGAGAAGLFCAARLGAAGVQVVVLEHTNSPGKKIRISGGGRCNFTNRQVSAENFLSENNHFCKSALAGFTPNDFVELVNEYRIPWHEKTLGQLFCDGSAQSIIDMLMTECYHGNVSVQLGVTISTITKADIFTVYSSNGVYETPTVVIATGGLSIPKIGATDFGYRTAHSFGIPVVETYPALVPIICDQHFTERFSSLAGVSLPVRALAGSAEFRERMLFTHRGLSGPAILQISSYLQKTHECVLDVFPDGIPQSLEHAGQSVKRQVSTLLSEHLPNRFVQLWPNPNVRQPRSALSVTTYLSILEELRAWHIHPVGNEGYEKAEVTGGGVDTAALSSKTFETRTITGLYFIGEVVDVTGWLGGYNFQWAWSSAAAAARAIAERTSVSR